MKIGNNGNLVLGLVDESTPCLMIVLMNCQTKLRINHLTAVKSVAILESNANLNFYTWKKKHSLQRIKWAGHVITMNEDSTTKKRFNAQPIGTRRKGRPNLIWIDGLGIGKQTLAGRRLAWKRLLEKAKANPGLPCH
ncbi:alpha-2 adrenergic receptor [Trichonephila clavipes]|nr:alpha-2 adrenergic receptor [Trichonephila clavipes]